MKNIILFSIQVELGILVTHESLAIKQRAESHKVHNHKLLVIDGNHWASLTEVWPFLYRFTVPDTVCYVAHNGLSNFHH